MGGGGARFGVLGLSSGPSNRNDPPAQESRGIDRRTSTIARDAARWRCLLLAAMGHPIIQRVEQFRCSRGTSFAECRPAATPSMMRRRVRRWRACVQPQARTGLKSFTGRAGKNDAPPRLLLGAPSWHSMTR